MSLVNDDTMITSTDLY